MKLRVGYFHRLANKNSRRTDVNVSVTDEETRSLPRAGLKRKQGQTLHIKHLKHWAAAEQKKKRRREEGDINAISKHLILKVSCD